MGVVAMETNFSLLFLAVTSMVMVIFAVPEAKADDGKETKFTVYFHDYTGTGPNVTDRPIVGFPGNVWNFTQTGTIYLADDLVTEGPNLTSATVGSYQGITVTTGMGSVRAFMSFSLIFTNEAYNGSTIQVQGNYDNSKSVNEYGVVSGTGKFRSIGGYVNQQTAAAQTSNSVTYTLVQINATIYHY